MNHAQTRACRAYAQRQKDNGGRLIAVRLSADAVRDLDTLVQHYGSIKEAVVTTLSYQASAIRHGRNQENPANLESTGGER